jgi:hypothetical protein
MKEYQVHVEETPKRHGGFPHLEQEGCIIPMKLKNGLLTIQVRTPTEHELNTCEVITLTSDDPWDPSEIHDEDLSEEEYIAYCNNYFDEPRQINLHWTKAKPMDIQKVEKFFFFPGKETMKKTLQATTQLGKFSTKIPLKPHYKSRNPILSKRRLMEPFATDTWFSTVTSYEGYNCCQIFVGEKSKQIYNYGLVSEASGPQALLDFFREIGVPISIRRDNSKMQTSQAWNDLMRLYNSSDKFIEPHNPQQNPAERSIGTLKNAMKRAMAETGCDPKAWYRLACHIADICNHTAYKSLNWRTPIEYGLGETPDISGLIIFKF